MSNCSRSTRRCGDCLKATSPARPDLIMAEVGVVVRSLDDLGPVLSRIEELGRRHASYGVESRYFSIAGPILLDALQAELGPAFTEEARSVWATAYTTLTDAMITAMTESAP